MHTSLFQNSSVRDLAWVLASPPIIQGNIDTCHWTDSAFWQQQGHAFHNNLLQADTDASALQHLLKKQTDRRLGHRFESLLSYWFNNSDQYQLVAQNLQVQDAEKTVGEFDFIVKDHLNNTHQHWEVACKFYLGLGDTAQLGNWYGPMLKDRLAIKYKQMQNRQSQLSHHPASVNILNTLGIRIQQHICLMKGRLFYPLTQSKKTPPNLVSNDHQQGWWSKTNDFFEYYKESTLRWCILSKHQWLAQQNFNPMESSYSTTELIDVFSCEANPRPICVTGFLTDSPQQLEQTRGFLVAKDWANAIIINDNSNQI
ncbi:MAG: DUF1853 family protein [Cycloclasticus sp.]|nr:DUF1853 family protein [Cycloclasticus sp.]MBQ0789221.1 DUF1853 family protein [Cycloclasticus sp.]